MADDEMETALRRVVTGGRRALAMGTDAECRTALELCVEISQDALGEASKQGKACPFCGRTDSHTHTSGPAGVT